MRLFMVCSPVLEPFTKCIHTPSQRGRIHGVLLLLLPVALLGCHGDKLLDGGRRGDDDGVGTLPGQQILVDHLDAVQELCRTTTEGTRSYLAHPRNKDEETV